MRNERTLVERVVLSKAIDGGLHTFEVDIHREGDRFIVYVYDPDESFESPPLSFREDHHAREAFEAFIRAIATEPVQPTDTAYEFAERVAALVRQEQESKKGPS